jgi:hypothetical protein
VSWVGRCVCGIGFARPAILVGDGDGAIIVALDPVGGKLTYSIVWEMVNPYKDAQGWILLTVL